MRGDGGRVEQVFAAWLSSQGWQVRRQVGYMDVVAERNGQRLVAEVKGRTGSPGLDVDTLFGQLLRRMAGGRQHPVRRGRPCRSVPNSRRAGPPGRAAGPATRGVRGHRRGRGHPALGAWVRIRYRPVEWGRQPRSGRRVGRYPHFRSPAALQVERKLRPGPLSAFRTHAPRRRGRATMHAEPGYGEKGPGDSCQCARESCRSTMSS